MIQWANETKRAYEEVAHLVGQGRTADYIPELKNVRPDQFGLCLLTADGDMHRVGDADVPFSIQSMSKVLLLSMVLRRNPKCFDRVDVEPSGNPFNSLIQLESENGIPRNPFINAGALVMTDMLMEIEADPKQAMLDFVSDLAGEPIHTNLQVARSELETADRNRALAHFMRSFGNIRADIEPLLDVYCHHSAIEMTLEQVVKAYGFLAREGINGAGVRVLTESQTKRINALMLTCGFYDESGEFAFRVGLPGKSGVGGGIVTVLPGQFCLATWSPGLNDKGNSLVGMEALERFTSNTRVSLFGHCNELT